MRKIAVILSLVIVALFLASCTTIDERYTGKRIRTEPAARVDEDYDRSIVYGGAYVFDPYYYPYYDPFFWTGFSFWNPFWHYGFLGYSYYGYYSPYYWGYSWYYPYWGSRYSGRSTRVRTVIRKDQLSGRSARGRSVVRVKGGSGTSRVTTKIRSRSLSPRVSAPPARSTTRTVVKKKK